MKIARFTMAGQPSPAWGLVQGQAVQPIQATMSSLAQTLRQGGAFTPQGPARPLEQVDLLPPCEPTKIVCVGLNYKHHAEEMNKAIPEEPLLFLKPCSALLPHLGQIELPPSSREVHHEGELAVVIGQRCRRVSQDQALGYVLGAMCLNDVTARDIQQREKRYTRGKGFDTFAPCGPWLETELDLQLVEVTCRVNGQVRQRSTTADMIFPVAEVISFVSHIMTLEPGDIITTGTPSGVGALEDGDTVEVELSGVGTLRNTVVRRP